MKSPPSRKRKSSAPKRKPLTRQNKLPRKLPRLKRLSSLRPSLLKLKLRLRPKSSSLRLKMESK